MPTPTSVSPPDLALAKEFVRRLAGQYGFPLLAACPSTPLLTQLRSGRAGLKKSLEEFSKIDRIALLGSRTRGDSDEEQDLALFNRRDLTPRGSCLPLAQRGEQKGGSAAPE
jgi:hypothetical protein